MLAAIFKTSHIMHNCFLKHIVHRVYTYKHVHNWGLQIKYKYICIDIYVSDIYVIYIPWHFNYWRLVWNIKIKVFKWQGVCLYLKIIFSITSISHDHCPTFIYLTCTVQSLWTILHSVKHTCIYMHVLTWPYHTSCACKQTLNVMDFNKKIFVW